MQAVNSDHFTGKRGSCSRKKRKSTRRQRRMKRRTHVNKYQT